LRDPKVVLRLARFARLLTAAMLPPSRRDMPEDTLPPLPDRLSLDPRSPFFDADILKRGVGIRFNGQEKTNVEEYCVSEGWIRVAAGRSRDRFGNPMTVKLKGQVEPYVDPKLGTGQADEGVASEGSRGLDVRRRSRNLRASQMPPPTIASAGTLRLASAAAP
jgi:hypothetical protein